MNKPRGILIAGNWKMNLGPAEAQKFFRDLQERWANLSESSRKRTQSGELRMCLFPPMLSLTAALPLGKTLGITVGAQNAHWEKQGAFTGEVSGPMLQEAGIPIVLIGHSERRQYFGETDETVRKRTESLLSQGLQVMLCIGETRSERESGQTQAVLHRQLQAVFPEAGKGAAAYLDGRLIIAYEPVWAIGTGLTATPEQAEEAHQIVRTYLRDRLGDGAAQKTPILYGGSVTPQNAQSLLSGANIDGALVGGASVKPESYLALIEAGATVF